MVGADTSVAGQFLQIARLHHDCVGGAVIEPDGGSQRIRLDMRVEMPLAMKVAGISPSGVRTCEPVVARLPPDYPWHSPRFTLREDFPRHFPHLMPFSVLPRPCLVDGDQDEFFLQFGLVDYGIFQLVDQLSLWLRKAAINGLIDKDQGWEPMLRRDYRDVLELDAEQVRAAVNKQGGWAVWQAHFSRSGPMSGALTVDAEAWISSKGVKTPLKRKEGDTTFQSFARTDNLLVGNTVMAVIWPDKKPDGNPFVSDTYLPEDIETLADLRARALGVGCGRGLTAFLSNLERSFSGLTHPAPIPVGIVLCVRRPTHLIGSSSPIELLPYVVEIRADPERTSLFAQADAEPVSPAMHYQSLSSALLRSMSNAPERPSLVLLGCGSVGSKLALHAARSGQSIACVSDNGWLRPHNMARHGLGPSHVPKRKAEALAKELSGYGMEPNVHSGDLSTDLRDGSERSGLFTPRAGAMINTTASLAVREALIGGTRARDKQRQFEAALFGRGRGAYLLADGAKHNPNVCDLMAELSVVSERTRAAELLFDPAEGLAEIQIGQGCGSLTMAMNDARLSAMTAGLSLEIDRILDASAIEGTIVLGTMADGSPSTDWVRYSVSPLTTVDIEGSAGWQLRVSQRVVSKIQTEVARYPSVETGGVMVGLASARLKTVTVVDLLDAPADSQRSASTFVLGTQGLQKAIQDRHERSGNTLFDVGTWHTHLADVGPSLTDWSTAAALAAERTPPSILLIATPKRFHALIDPGKTN